MSVLGVTDPEIEEIDREERIVDPPMIFARRDPVRDDNTKSVSFSTHRLK